MKRLTARCEPAIVPQRESCYQQHKQQKQQLQQQQQGLQAGEQQQHQPPQQMDKKLVVNCVRKQRGRAVHCPTPAAVVTGTMTRITGPLPLAHVLVASSSSSSTRANKSPCKAADKQGILPNKKWPRRPGAETKVAYRMQAAGAANQPDDENDGDYRKCTANAAIGHRRESKWKIGQATAVGGSGGCGGGMPKRTCFWILAVLAAVCVGSGTAISAADFLRPLGTTTTTATTTTTGSGSAHMATNPALGLNTITANQTKTQSATKSTSPSSAATASAPFASSTSAVSSTLSLLSSAGPLQRQRAAGTTSARTTPPMTTTTAFVIKSAQPMPGAAAGATRTNPPPLAPQPGVNGATALNAAAAALEAANASLWPEAAALTLERETEPQQQQQQHHQLQQEAPVAALTGSSASASSAAASSLAAAWRDSPALATKAPPALPATAAASLIVAIVTSGSVIRARNTHDNRSASDGSHEDFARSPNGGAGGAADDSEANFDLSGEDVNATLMDHKAFADTLIKGFMIPTFLPPFPAFAMADLPLYTTAAPPPITTTPSSQEQYAWSGGGDTRQDQLYLAAYNRQRHHHRPRGGSNGGGAGNDGVGGGDAADGVGQHHHNSLMVSSSNVSVQLGSHAYMPCHIRRLTNKPISWIRVRDGHILSVDQTTFIADQRFQSIYNENDEFSWSLQIKYVQPIDKGWYECQVSSEPKMSAKVFLKVVVPVTELIGDQNRFVKEGSKVVLHCIVRGTIEAPEYIAWHRGVTQIDDNNKMGWFTQLDRNIFGNQSVNQNTIGSLIIPFVRKMDSGNYTCQPSNAAGVSVDLHVLSGEYSASAIMSTGSPSTWRGCLLPWASSWPSVFVAAAVVVLARRT